MDFYSLLLEEHDDLEVIVITTVVVKGPWDVGEDINR